MDRKTNPTDWQWTYVGMTGPFQIISPSGHVVAVVHSDDPNSDISLVAKITKLCAKHAKASK